jgi:exopolysaccharide biosynthesis protein
MFKIKWWDNEKRDNKKNNTYFSSGYFGNFASDTGAFKFTLPSGNLIADIDAFSINNEVLGYLKERKVENGKLYYPASLNTDSRFRKAKVSTLCIDQQNKASIIKLNNFIGTNYKYAVSGAPVILNGQYVSDFTSEGWDTSIVRPTTHILVGTKKDNDNFIYIFPYTTSTTNCLKSKELYNKFKDFGFNNLLKLDGGGSAYAKVNDKVVANTNENRQINTLIVIE